MSEQPFTVEIMLYFHQPHPPPINFPVFNSVSTKSSKTNLQVEYLTTNFEQQITSQFQCDTTFSFFWILERKTWAVWQYAV